MKKAVLCALSSMIFLPSFGQAKIEIQIGGSNFLGMTINSAYDIPVSKNRNQILSPYFGIGFLAPDWDGATSIIHVGLDYTIKKFGVGCELSNFLPSPFGQRDYPQSDVDLIVYPNISYTFSTKIKLYFKVSGGAYFAFNKQDFYSGSSEMYFEGDVIPGAGFTTGYKF
jgi:hypothetical protein